jgi:hypothetical protein
MLGGWLGIELDQAVAHPADMLGKEHAAELLQAGRWIVERSDDRLAFGNVEAEHLDATP